MLIARTRVSKGFKDFKKRIQKFLDDANSVQMRAGFVSPDHYPSGESIASVAAKQEFGGISSDFQKTVPPRPFMRPTIASEKGKWINLFKEFLLESKSSARGRVNFENSFGRLGSVVANDIRNTIKGVFDPPLAPHTIEQRRMHDNESDKPLIDTGTMLNAVSYIVEKRQ